MGAAFATVGFVAGAAAMGSYVEARPPETGPEPAAQQHTVAEGIPGVDGAVRGVGTPVVSRVCDVANLGGNGTALPVVSQVSSLGTVAVDAVGGVTGGGECTVRRA